MLAMLGCETPVTATPRTPAGAASATRSTIIEAGVVLDNRSGYLCLPLQQVGLLPDDQIVSLSSSCECIQPRLVEYHTGSNSTGRAVFLEYVDATAGSQGDSATDPSNRSLANLGVIVEATLTDGRRHAFTVNLLHTYLAEEEHL